MTNAVVAPDAVRRSQDAVHLRGVWWDTSLSLAAPCNLLGGRVTSRGLRQAIRIPAVTSRVASEVPETRSSK